MDECGKQLPRCMSMCMCMYQSFFRNLARSSVHPFRESANSARVHALCTADAIAQAYAGLVSPFRCRV